MIKKRIKSSLFIYDQGGGMAVAESIDRDRRMRRLSHIQAGTRMRTAAQAQITDQHWHHPIEATPPEPGPQPSQHRTDLAMNTYLTIT